jgi:hypothetical protein
MLRVVAVPTGRARWALTLSLVMMAVAALAGSTLAATAKPSLGSFLPRGGSAGTTVTITGKNFTGASAVRIDGLKATYRVRSATRITAIVPSKATTGKITVTTNGGTVTSPVSFDVYAADGSGTLTSAILRLLPSSTGNVLKFTYTAGTGGMGDGAVTITVPKGWSEPVTRNAVGCTTTTVGTVRTSGQTITVSGLSLPGGGRAVITYAATSGGVCATGDGATASANEGAATWHGQQKSTPAGRLTNLSSSPSIWLAPKCPACGSTSGSLGAATTSSPSTPASSPAPTASGSTLPPCPACGPKTVPPAPAIPSTPPPCPACGGSTTTPSPVTKP